MTHGFHDGSRSLQDRFDTRALADRIDQLLVTDSISDGDRAFIEARDMFFLATADADGRPTCSYKGGEPGFVHVLDPHTVAFPSFDGNGMYLSTGNVLLNPRRRDAVHRLCCRRQIPLGIPVTARCWVAEAAIRRAAPAIRPRPLTRGQDRGITVRTRSMWRRNSCMKLRRKAAASSSVTSPDSGYTSGRK